MMYTRHLLSLASIYMKPSIFCSKCANDEHFVVFFFQGEGYVVVAVKGKFCGCNCRSFAKVRNAIYILLVYV